MMMKQPLADPRERTLDQRPRTKRRPRIGLHPSSSSPPHQLDVTPPGMQLERIDYHRFPQTQAHRIATEGIRRHEPAAAASVHCSAPADRQHRRITTTPDDREAPVAPPTQGTLTPPTTSAPRGAATRSPSRSTCGRPNNRTSTTLLLKVSGLSTAPLAAATNTEPTTPDENKRRSVQLSRPSKFLYFWTKGRRKQLARDPTRTGDLRRDRDMAAPSYDRDRDP